MFTPSQVMSAYSLLKSPMSVKRYVKQAVEYGYNTLVLSEWHTLSSATVFYQECQAAGVKAIIGLQFISNNTTLLAIAENTKGYFELVDLSSRLMTQQSIEQTLLTYQHIVYVTTGQVSKEQIAVLQQNLPKHKLMISVYKTDDDRMRLAKQLDIPVLMNKVVTYLTPSDYATQLVLQAIDENNVLDKQVFDKVGYDYLPTPEDFKQQFDEQIYLQTQQFFDRIELAIPFHQKLLPKFSEQASEQLRKLAYEGLSKRGLTGEAYMERLEKELLIINNMGFSDYFLIVWDLMAYAHKQQIMTGAGRGSSAASLVSYCLFITQVDPVKQNLLFERFLNPERYTMPDIDLDFPDNKRQDILKYVISKYGRLNVAQIATFGTFAAKQALRDVARVCHVPANILKRLSDAIPNSRKITLEKAYESSKALRQLVDYQEEYRRIFDMAKKIEGLPRHVSTHAAGVVISDHELSTLIPMQQTSDQTYLTQFTMQEVERVGLLKMDFLGLKNLAILADAQQVIQTLDPAFDVWRIDWQDDKTLAIFASGDTEGVFQFESSGIRRVLRQVVPKSLADVASVNALYRPGPMEQISHFANRKHKIEAVVYPHEDLKDILEETYGIIVYQEQVMQIASKMAGFSLGQADILRRAIGKMQKDVMLDQKKSFINGACENGYDINDATKVYQYIEKFANYGFPKSHAYAYSVLAYQLAYVKAHYPNAFYLSLMLHTNAKSERFSVYVMEAKQHGVQFNLPSINDSTLHHKVQDKQTILLGLDSIQGLRRDIRLSILDERAKGGLYASMEDFVLRLPKLAKKDVLELLIYAGAFDSFGMTRATLIENIPTIIEQSTLFLGIPITPKYDEKEEFSQEIMREKEQAILGFSFSNHELDAYTKYYQKDLLQVSIEAEPRNAARFLGYLKKIRRIQTKQGKRMAFATLEDQFGKINLTIFPEVYQHYVAQLQEKSLCVVYGKVEINQENTNCLVQRIESVEAFVSKEKDKLYVCFLKVKKITDYQMLLPILKQHKGNMPVVVYFEETKTYQKLAERYAITWSKKIEEYLKEQLGDENVVKKER